MQLVTKLIEDLTRQNNTTVFNRIKTVVLTEIERFRESFEEFCKEKMPVDDNKVLVLKFTNLKDASHDSVKSALIDLPGAFESHECHSFISEKEELLQELLNLKLISNENLVKDTQINKLREEAVKTQIKLVEQNKQLEKYWEDEKKNTAAMKAELDELKAKIENERKVDDARTKELQKKLEDSKREMAKKRSCVIL